MSNTLQIKRSSSYDGTSNPTSLSYGELGWNNGSSKLFVGKQTTSGGTVESFHVSTLADLTVTSSTGISATLGSGNSDNALTLAGIDATSSVKGVASFASADFSVSSGAVSIASGGVSNAQLAGSIANAKLANSSITVSDGSNSTARALGSTITFSGTANEIEVAESSGTITVGLPNNVTVGNNLTIEGNLTVNGNTTTVNSTTLDVDDINITVAKGAANASAANGAGLTVDGASATFNYASSGDKWTMNKPLDITGTLAVSSTSAFTGAITASGGFANTTFDGGTF
jgi:hypothetical protein|tara:strand:- start:199 stop:1059 length:861 start_codon:yes stop_codon:yes gene_type:complete